MAWTRVWPLPGQFSPTPTSACRAWGPAPGARRPRHGCPGVCPPANPAGSHRGLGQGGTHIGPPHVVSPRQLGVPRVSCGSMLFSSGAVRRGLRGLGRGGAGAAARTGIPCCAGIQALVSAIDADHGRSWSQACKRSGVRIPIAPPGQMRISNVVLVTISAPEGHPGDPAGHLFRRRGLLTCGAAGEVTAAGTGPGIDDVQEVTSADIAGWPPAAGSDHGKTGGISAAASSAIACHRVIHVTGRVILGAGPAATAGSPRRSRAAASTRCRTQSRA